MAFFTAKEFLCRCGKCPASREIPGRMLARVAQLMANLEEMRKLIGLPMVVTSGIRCSEHNEAEGGEPNSKHLTGQAADVKVEGWSGDRLAGFVEALIAMGVVIDGGLGTYSNRIHYDTAASRRWRG